MAEFKLPETLIKYYECNKFNCDAITKNYLWASNPADFNDPFECSIFSLDENSFSKEWLLKTTESWSHEWWTENKIQNRYKYYSMYLRFIGLLCLNEFEEKNQDLMWGYYNNQKGFAIEFHAKVLVENLKEYPVKVSYKEKEDFDVFRIDNRFQYNELLKKWIIQKKKIWDRETEWRFIFNDLIVDPVTFQTKPETRRKRYDVNSINKVYLGFRFFNSRNLVQESNDTYIYIMGKEDTFQSQILSYLAFPSIIKVNHIFPKYNEHQLFPRECRIFKQDSGRFKVKYLE